MRKEFVIWFAAALCLMISVLEAAPIYVENAGFEEPDEGKLTSWESVPGWSTDTVATNSGVDTFYYEGSYTGYGMGENDWGGNDPPVWQLTDHTIAWGEVYTLSFAYTTSYGVGTLVASLYYDDGDSRVTIDSVTVNTTGIWAGGWDLAELTVYADEEPEAIGKRIGIQFDVTVNWVAFDAVSLESEQGPIDVPILPDPYRGEVEVAVDLSDRTIADNFSWAAPVDPNIAEIRGYYIYVDPNEVKVLNRDNGCEIVADTGTAQQYDPASDFGWTETLYWVVDTYYTHLDDPNLGTPDEVVYVGAPTRAWSFTTKSAIPSIDTYDSVLTASAQLPATVSAAVSDGDNNLVSASFEVLDDDAEFPAGATYILAEDVSNLYAPSAELDTDTEGTYKIKLTVTDGSDNEVSAIAEIVVYDDACAAAQASGNWVGFNYYDRDTDCDVDLDDFVLFALEWLEDIGLYEPETYSSDEVEYLPLVNGVVNGNFETGDLLGYWSGGAIVTDVDPIEGNYSAEWTVEEGGSGITQWLENLSPSTAYEFSVQIQGGATSTAVMVRYHGYEEVTVNPKNSNLQTVTVPFTTGPESTTADLVIWDEDAIGFVMKVDDLRVVAQ
jgi:hypothetical protein